MTLKRVKLGERHRERVSVRGPVYLRVYTTYEFFEVPPGVEVDLIQVSSFEYGSGEAGWVAKGFEQLPEEPGYHEGPYR